MLLGESAEPFFASAPLYEECEEDIGNFSAPACGGTTSGCSADMPDVMDQLYGSVSWNTFVNAAHARSLAEQASSCGGNTGSAQGTASDQNRSSPDAFDRILAEYEEARQQELERMHTEAVDGDPIDHMIAEYEKAKQNAKLKE